MNAHRAQDQFVPHIWLQHNLPWLGVFALIAALLRDEPLASLDRPE